MTFTQQFSLVNTGLFREQIRMAIITGALDVIGEAIASPANVTKDKIRHDLGVNVLNDSQNDVGVWLQRFALTCAANDNLNPDPTLNTDADIQFTVNAVWDDLAGLEGKDS